MSYKRSEVYKLGLRLAILTEQLCRGLPKHEQYCLAQQLRNSSRSIVANYVEGYVRQTTSIKDHRRFMIYSQGSCDETKYWLELAKAIDLIQPESVKELLEGYARLGRLIYSVLSRSS